MIFNRRLNFFARYGALILFAFGVAAPFVLVGAGRTIRSNTNKVADWLPASYSETTDLRWFREHFVADQFVVVSWEGCHLGGNPLLQDAAEDDPRIEQLAQLLVPPGQSEQDSLPAESTRYFKEVTTARHLLDRMTAEPNGVPYEVAVERLKGSLIGSDGRDTCLVVTLTDAAITDLRSAIGRPEPGTAAGGRDEGALFAALRTCGITPEEAHLGGPPVDNVSIDQEGEKTMVRLAGLAALFGIGLAWFSLRSLVLTGIVFACGILSAAASLALVTWTGSTSDAVLLSMPSLVYVLAISGSIHLINYYRRTLAESGPIGAVDKALARGWKPAFLCSVTTAFGLLSLCTSDLTPIRKFGFYSAMGVLQTLVILFLFLPSALQAWPITHRGGTAADRVPLPKPRRRPVWWRHMTAAVDSFWHRFGGGIIRHHRWVTAGSLAVIAGLSWGISRTDTSVDLMKLFDPQARILHDYRWLESHVGQLVPMEIVLRFDHSILREPDQPADQQPQLNLLERAQLVTEVQRTIENQFGQAGSQVVGPSLSAATFVPPLPTAKRGTLALLRRTATNSKLEQAYPDLLKTGYLTHDETTGDELWRISLRVAAFEDIDYGQFTSQLKSIVDPLVAAHNQKLAVDAEQPPIRPVYTGVVPIVYKAQRALLDSLVESTCWSFLTITPLLMLVSRGILAGAVTMLPNVLPILVVFGGMGWLGLPIDIGSMMSASIALGVAVDDTIHYLTWFREAFDVTGDRPGAILSAYEHCATPALQAALINGLGLSVFAFSTFAPTKQFGVLMLTILIAGVVAELILLPALLAGPLGRVFRRRWRGGPATAVTEPNATVQESSSPGAERKKRPHGRRPGKARRSA